MTAAPQHAPAPAAGAPTPEDLRAWLATAQPGQRFVYFTGLFLPKEAKVVRAARTMSERGEVILTQQRREDRRFDYQMTKRRNVERPVASAAAVAGRNPQRDTDEESDSLMAILRRLASRGETCPTNPRLAEMALLRDGESVRYRLGLLQQCGRIDVATNAAGVRVVTIVASGRRTRG